MAIRSGSSRMANGNAVGFRESGGGEGVQGRVRAVEVVIVKEERKEGGAVVTGIIFEGDAPIGSPI